MKKNDYESPQVEMIEVTVEQGFGASVSGGAFDDDGTVVTPPMS